MKALVMHEYGKLSYEDVAKPTPGKGEVLIRLKACSVCVFLQTEQASGYHFCRIAAWIIGTRNMYKALLTALLMPHDTLRTLQQEERYTELMALQEALKTMPMGVIWEEYCARQGVPADDAWIDNVLTYEKEVLLKRG